MTGRFVLDAWAVLALLQGEEPAASRVRDLVESAGSGGAYVALSWINLGEVYYRLGRARGQAEAERAVDLLRRSGVHLLLVDEDTVLAAARLKMRHPVAYADAFALAAAQAQGATLVTGDPELLALKGQVPLERLTRGRG